MFIKDNLSWINIGIACRCLDLNRSSYYAWFSNELSRTNRRSAQNKLLNQVKAVHAKSKGRYGCLKITQALKAKDTRCSVGTVAKLMKANDIRSIASKKFKATTDSKHNLDVFDNVLNRQFVVPHVNYAWVNDITYIRTNEGWLYLATVIDLYSNRVIGYSMSERMTKALVIDALNKALKLRNYPTNVIVHTDRGSQYASCAYKALLNKHNLIGSMSRAGNCWDNSIAENFFGILKREYIYQTKFITRTDARLGIFDYIESWYNTQRIHSKLNYLSPIEFEMDYIAQNAIQPNLISVNFSMKFEATVATL